MIRKILLVVFFLFSANSVLISQSYISFRIVGEYNFFSMSDLQDIQTEIRNDLQVNNIPAKKVETFPPYFGMQFQIAFLIKSFTSSNLILGFLFDISSTGGRVHYSDYSGEISFDQIVKVNSFGPFLEVQRENDDLIFSMGVKAPLIWATLNNKFLTRIGNNKEEDNIELSSFTVGLEPNIGVSYTTSNFIFGVNLGYLISIPDNYTLNNSDAFLQKKNGTPVTIGTSGARFGLTLGYNLFN